MVEGADGDGQAGLLEGLEPLPRVLVPEVEGAVAAGRGERTELRMECDAVHRVDVLIVPVALERKVLLILDLVHVVDGDAALD